MTRDRVVTAAVELLSRGDAAEIGMQDVADHAGVSVRTLYRNFATREELFDTVVGAIRDRMTEMAGPPPSALARQVDATHDAVRAVFELEPLYRALFATQAGRESHQRGARGRRAAMTKSMAAEVEGLSDDEVRLFTSLLHVVTSSTSVLFLKDYWGLDADEAGQVLQWGVGVLLDAMRDPERRRQL
jgi:AcrR family transcriptional regulator